MGEFTFIAVVVATQAYCCNKYLFGAGLAVLVVAGGGNGGGNIVGGVGAYSVLGKDLR